MSLPRTWPLGQATSRIAVRLSTKLMLFLRAAAFNPEPYSEVASDTPFRISPGKQTGRPPRVPVRNWNGTYSANRKKDLSYLINYFGLVDSCIVRFRIRNAADDHKAASQPLANCRPGRYLLRRGVRNCHIELPVDKERHSPVRCDFA